MGQGHFSIRKFGAFGLATLIAVLANGCIETPGIKDASRRIATFKHTGQEASCTLCHESKRPAPTHGSGQDCIACHIPGATWLSGIAAFNHQPPPATCINCHLGKRPTMVINGFDHANGGTGDCVNCHKSPGGTWGGGVFSHTPAPTTCIGCHSDNRPTGLIGGFDHAFGGTGDCVSCHKNPGVTWTGGTFSHTPTPASCNDCHNPDRPTVAIYPKPTTTVTGHYTSKDCYQCHRPQSATVTTFNFRHTNAAGAPVNSCLPCHQAQGVKEHGNNVKDCVSCHKINGF